MARSASPDFHHSSARSTRPPSSGYPGTRLNAAKPKLMYPNQVSMIFAGVTALGKARPLPGRAARSATLVNGPTMAIWNSVFASGDSPSICDTPPSANRVISRTGIPCALATRECASSCNSRETKNRIAVAMARAKDQPRGPCWIGQVELGV